VLPEAAMLRRTLAGIETETLSLKETKNAVEQLVNVNERNMQNTIEHSVRVKESEIGAVAYRMWEEAGHPAGRDLQFWLDAEAHLRAVAKTAFATPVTLLSPAASNNNAVYKTASVHPAPSQPKPAKAQRKSRKS
jgi:hypothetical protein